MLRHVISKEELWKAHMEAKARLIAEVQEAPGGGVSVSIADPRVMFRLVGNPDLEPVVEEAETRLRRVIEALG
jgi:hypothetical protein